MTRTQQESKSTLVRGGTGKPGRRVVERLTARGLEPDRPGRLRSAPRKETDMASDTPTRTPFKAGPERPDENYTRRALENPATRDDPTGAERNAGGVLGAAVVVMGLFAGLSYTFTLAVMPGLTAADDRTLVDAMQQMIDNPVFPLTFLAAGVLVVAALVQARRSGAAKTAGWIVAGLALYTVWLVVTFAVHVPLNEELKDAGDPARIDNLAAVRDDFATPWVAWDIVRTLASTAAFACLAWALAVRGRMKRAAP